MKIRELIDEIEDFEFEGLSEADKERLQKEIDSRLKTAGEIFTTASEVMNRSSRGIRSVRRRTLPGGVVRVPHSDPERLEEWRTKIREAQAGEPLPVIGFPLRRRVADGAAAAVPERPGVGNPGEARFEVRGPEAGSAIPDVPAGAGREPADGRFPTPPTPPRKSR